MDTDKNIANEDKTKAPAMFAEETSRLIEHLKNAVVIVGDIYKHTAYAQKALAIEAIAPRGITPPASKTQRIASEIQQYDQICDILESHLTHALAIIRRDVVRERARVEAETRAQELKKADEAMNVDTSVTESATDDSALGVGAAGRRSSSFALPTKPSKANVIPLKLDLSPETLNDIPTELLPSSPVTLAPRTARPRTDTLQTPISSMEPLIPDLLSVLAAQNEGFGAPPQPSDVPVIDLTMDNSSDDGGQKAPIDLTIDMLMSQDNESNSQIHDLLMGSASNNTASQGTNSNQDPLGLFTALSGAAHTGVEDTTASLLASLTNTAGPSVQDPESSSNALTNNDDSANLIASLTTTAAGGESIIDPSQKVNTFGSGGSTNGPQGPSISDPIALLSAMPLPEVDGQTALDAGGIGDFDLGSDFFLMNNMEDLQGALSQDMMDNFFSNIGDGSGLMDESNNASSSSPKK
jgi:hypothetical protein